MDNQYYLSKFQKALERLDLKQFQQQQLELKVGMWLNSAVLKIQKKAWLNSSATAKPFQESVFFSVWVNDDTTNQGRVYYNIHALKMRELTGYRIKSRDFAEAFRARCKPFATKWPNIRLDYGPLTLMEGWVKLDEDTLEENIAELASRFLEIHHLIDELLSERKK